LKKGEKKKNELSLISLLAAAAAARKWAMPTKISSSPTRPEQKAVKLEKTH
jgi:hypothetical protein